jgi:cell division septation protein DedD
MAGHLTTVLGRFLPLGFFAAMALALAGPAASQAPSPAPAQTSPQPPSVSYPPSRSLADVFAWLKKDTPINSAQVVDVSPSAITAIVSSSPTGQPRGFLATIASEAVNPEIVSHDGIASWSIPAEVDCDRRQVRLGAMTGFRSRDLRSESRVMRAADTAFVVPTPTAPLGAVVRALCDRDFKRPVANAKGKGKGGGQLPLVVAEAKPPTVVVPQKPQAAPAPAPADPPAVAPTATADDAPTAPKGAGPKTVEMKKPAEPKTIEMPGPAEPAEPAPKPKPKPRPKPPAGGGAFSLQLGASPTMPDANLLIAKFKKAYGGSMGGLTLGVATVQIDNKPVNRVLLSGFASSLEASRFCDALQASRQPCFVRR